MKRFRAVQILTCLLAAAGSVMAQQTAPLRPPAIPLVTHDPYFSVWSNTNELPASPTRHWTGSEQPLTGLIGIDGAVYRFLGGQRRLPDSVQPMQQTGFELTPTRTSYRFETSGVRLDLTFLTPALPDDLDILSRPATYLIWDIHAMDGKEHQVKLYLDAASHLAVDRPDQRTVWSRHKVAGMDVLRIGSADQRILNRSGDDLRIDWGYFYIAVPWQDGQVETIGTTLPERENYTGTLELPTLDSLDIPEYTSRATPVIGFALDLGTITSRPVRRYAILAYDDIFSIEYFHRKLRPYWRRARGAGPAEMLKAAAVDFESLRERCSRFDQELIEDLVAAGGPEYAALAVLAYRQTLAAHKLTVDWDGTPLYFSKENFSNGCIGTVDVTYPSSPFFLLLNPQLLKAQLRPVLDYAQSPRWRWPFAPHDLGQYPLANGQVYGGAEESEENQMPVEESGNMLIMMAALARAEGNANFSRRYWPLLTKWAEYLRAKGMDPENQLSTDDFAGHLARNTNLSIKAIVALASYGELAGQLGYNELAASYRDLSRQMASRWVEMADDGDHFRLAFDKPGTWSQKYNLVWDKLLNLNLFPADVVRKEIAWYKQKQNAFGLPLDNRSTYTKLDWILWTATLAGNQEDFRTLSQPAYRFANETPDRVPLSDWYWTLDGKQRGFRARSVVGGVYIKMLENPATWRKWAGRTTRN